MDNAQSISQKYDELCVILNTLEVERDYQLLLKRKEVSYVYFHKFKETILSQSIYCDYKFQFDLEIEAKRIAVLYTYFLDIYRKMVCGRNGERTNMSLYKIISASQATIINSNPIRNINDKIDETSIKLTVEFAFFYATQILFDWIGDSKAHSQNFAYKIDFYLSDQYVKEIVEDHFDYLEVLVYTITKDGTKEGFFDLFLMAQFWKLFHFNLFDPRTKNMTYESV